MAKSIVMPTIPIVNIAAIMSNKEEEEEGSHDKLIDDEGSGFNGVTSLKEKASFMAFKERISADQQIGTYIFLFCCCRRSHIDALC